MQKIKAFNEKRAEIYWWLSGLFTNELSTKELKQYNRPEIRTFLAGLGENQQLAEPVSQLTSILDQLLAQEDAQASLAESFHKLFHTCDQSSVLPYASLYMDKALINDKTPAQLITEMMESNGVHVQEHTSEPYDHLAVELDFLGHLIIRSNELEQPAHMEQALHFQGDYIRHHLLTWVPEFSFHCSRNDNLGFYGAISLLLVAFLQLDLNYLGGD